MEKFQIKPRETYIDLLTDALRESRFVIATGVRRSGKTCIATMLEERLREDFPDAMVQRVNFEIAEEEFKTEKEILSIEEETYQEAMDNFFILDEITHIQDWEIAVNKLYEKSNSHIVLFNSNEDVISDALDAVKSDEYRLVRILPLSLSLGISRIPGVRGDH